MTGYDTCTNECKYALGALHKYYYRNVYAELFNNLGTCIYDR